MRGLKIAAIAAVSLLLVMVLMVGYLFLTAEVRVTGVESQGTSAADDAEGFETLKTAIQDETFIGTLYQKPTEWADAAEYVYIDYTVHIRNNCLVSIDMVEAQIVPQTTDILQVGNLQVHSISPKSDGELVVRILAPKESHPVREIIVTYYVWGVSFNIKTMYGG